MTDIRGFKRICASCATRFYDFNKDPILCPKCGAEFTGVVKIRTRRGKAVVDDVKAKPEEEDEVEKADGDDTTVSLSDVEDDENAAVDDEEEETGGDLDLDDLDDDEDGEDDEDLEDLDEDLEIEEKE